MKTRYSPADDLHEDDPSAELGLVSPVRDKKRLGDEQYSPTPPREVIQPPEASHDGERCIACSARINPQQALRSDFKEYDYYFCSVDCRNRWRGGQAGTTRPNQTDYDDE